MSRKANVASTRVLQLDVLRGIAILLVIGRHLEIARPEGVVGFFADLWFTIGWLGVDLFFVLSGFLIGGLLLSELRNTGKMDVGRFLVRRGLKIYPPYFVFIAYLIGMPTLKASLAGANGFDAFASNWLLYWPNLLFLQNYVGTNPAGHTWTLAVEEHFYLLLPFILVLFAAVGRMRWLPLVCLVIIPLVVLALRTLSVLTADPFAVTMSATHLRLDGLLFGVGLRAVADQRPKQFLALRAWRRTLVACGVLLWLPHVFIDPATVFIRTIGLMVTYLGAAGFLVAAYHTHGGDFSVSRGIVTKIANAGGAIGVYSYAIYLWHVTALGIFEKLIISRLFSTSAEATQLIWLASALILTAGAIGVGVMAGRLVEWPVIRFRDRFFPSKSASLSPVPGTAAPGGPVQTHQPTAAAL